MLLLWDSKKALASLAWLYIKQQKKKKKSFHEQPNFLLAASQRQEAGNGWEQLRLQKSLAI